MVEDKIDVNKVKESFEQAYVTKAESYSLQKGAFRTKIVHFLYSKDDNYIIFTFKGLTRVTKKGEVKKGHNAFNLEDVEFSCRYNIDTKYMKKFLDAVGITDLESKLQEEIEVVLWTEPHFAISTYNVKNAPISYSVTLSGKLQLFNVN